MSKLIYMQSTIDFIIAKHNHRIKEIENRGIPEVIEQKDDKGIIVNKYYKFSIQNMINTKKEWRWMEDTLTHMENKKEHEKVVMPHNELEYEF